MLCLYANWMSDFWRKLFVSSRESFVLQRFKTLKVVAASGLLSVVLLSSVAPARGSDTCENPSFVNRTAKSMSTKIPCAYVPHGGGPLPILGDKDHVEMVNWLKKFVGTYLTGDKKPTSCLIISAHWEEKQATVQSGATTKLYYDYYGFPKESYNLKYTLPGATELSKRVGQLLESANIRYKVDNDRGYDHGVFIPMKILFPDGDIPTIQLSLVSGLDPKTHIKLGEALAPLRDEGVFVLGSGMSYHNMRGFNNGQSNKDSDPFHEYLRSSLVNSKNYKDKVAALDNWAKAPKARECHPREEHLMPLHVILGAAKHEGNVEVKEVFYDNVAGVKCAGYIFE
ncbi:Extradiol ring-cleavage dioxygenase [Orchesella cincta]|uniref:Extradiol ring-cleavage dioxygenase n=1 Tax=Orchesella cincta TaxID=48709 RepID=A0A1D2N8R9_ORCCI|nr:Extradiol ring-cleavage dioxygenase [Orchesella cincta]